MLLFADRRSFRCGVDACPVAQADLPEFGPGAVLNDRLKERIDESNAVRVFRQTDTVGIHRPEYIAGNGVSAGVLHDGVQNQRVVRHISIRSALFHSGAGLDIVLELLHNGIWCVLCQNARAGGTGLGRDNFVGQAVNAGNFSIACLDQYGLTVLGQPITWAGIVYWKGYWIDQVVFDNAYLYFAVALGIIWLIVLSFSFFRVEKYLTVTECILVTIYILFAITENYTVDVVYCFPMLFVSRLIFGMDGAGAESLYAEAATPSQETAAFRPEESRAYAASGRERRHEHTEPIPAALSGILPEKEPDISPEKLRAEAGRIRSEIRAEMKNDSRRELSPDGAGHTARRTEAETEKENLEWLAKWRLQRHE